MAKFQRALSNIKKEVKKNNKPGAKLLIEDLIQKEHGLESRFNNLVRYIHSHHHFLELAKLRIEQGAEKELILKEIEDAENLLQGMKIRMSSLLKDF